MDIAKLLQALEEMIFEVACMAVLLPKTFFHLALFPTRVHRYVAEELQKKREDRFDSYASPLIMWAVCGILPNFILLSIVSSTPEIRKMLAADGNDLLLKMLALPAETQFAAVSAFVVSLPLSFAVVIAREGKGEATKGSLREPLYTLSYCTAPILFAAMPLWFAACALPESDHAWVGVFAIVVVTMLLGWTAWVGARLFRLHLGVTWRRAFVLLVKAYFVFGFVVLLLEIVILMLLGSMVVRPKA